MRRASYACNLCSPDSISTQTYIWIPIYNRAAHLTGDPMTYTIHLDASTRLYYFTIRKSWKRIHESAAIYTSSRQARLAAVEYIQDAT